ncbi:MAG: hypothetical protein AB7F89_22275 [Pirellulaceae bacterium]
MSKVSAAVQVLFLGLIIFIPTYLFYNWKDAPRTVSASLPQGAAVFETSLQSRISSTDTSMTLVSNSVRGGSTLSGYNCFTIDEGRTDMEYVCGTVSGTAVSNLERGIDPLTASTTNSSLKFAHRVGANVKITDFPLIQRMRHQANGADTYANLLSYATTTTLCSVSSANETICDKAYIDGVAVAGASNGNETTKGIWEGATQIESASSTILGSTGAGLVQQARYATSSPGTTGLWDVWTKNNGKISQLFFDLTEHFNFTSIFAASASSTNATTTNLTVTGRGIFSGSATTSMVNLQATNNATTTNLTISGACTGCIDGYEIVTDTVAAPNSTGNEASQTATCTGSKIVLGGGTSISGDTISVEKSAGPSGTNAWTTTYRALSNGGTGTVTVYAICVNP